MSRRGIRGLKTRAGRESCISREELDCTVEVDKLEESEEGVAVLRVGDIADGATSRVLNLEMESCEHLGWTHLEQVQHCTDLPRQVAFPAHTERGKIGPGLG